MQKLIGIDKNELIGMLHVGQQDVPDKGMLDMQKLMDAHPNFIDDKINDIVKVQNDINEKILEVHITNTENPHSVTKAQVGLGNADNTSDLNKPVSTAQQTAFNTKVDKISGKGLSTNDYTTFDKSLVGTIPNKANTAEVLTKTNSTAFTPTGDYHPATKKYVLDSINTTGAVTKEQIALWDSKASLVDVAQAIAVATIDCGSWENTEVLAHSTLAATHFNLVVDGGNVTATAENYTLDEHLTDELAHQNLIVDGNI